MVLYDKYQVLMENDYISIPGSESYDNLGDFILVLIKIPDNQTEINL